MIALTSWMSKLEQSFTPNLDRMSTSDNHLRIPGLGLPVNFMPDYELRFPFLSDDHGYSWKARTLLHREIAMLQVMEELTNKPDWWRKVRDSTITDKWKKDVIALGQSGDWASKLAPEGFTRNMADAVIVELQRKADFYEEAGLVPVLDYSLCVIKSDKILEDDPDLVKDLKTAVSRLENVPDAQKDWHPRSGNKVLDLVHPSLYPLVYGKTRVLKDKRIDLANALDFCGAGEVIAAQQDGKLAENPAGDNEQNVPASCWIGDPFFSFKYQWLPCDVKLENGRAEIVSYINNLHPVDHAEMYPVIEKFIEKSLPAWDLCYRWPENYEHKRIDCTRVFPECATEELCPGICQPSNRPLEEGENPRTAEYEAEEVWYEGSERERKDTIWYNSTHSLGLPEPDPEKVSFDLKASEDVNKDKFFEDLFHGDVDKDFRNGTWEKGESRIQVIVKLANIHLTPDSPSYPGGTWHTEGQLNEHICATALFYYDSDNITDCRLDFRTMADEEGLMMELGHEQGDYHNIERAFAIDARGDLLQNIGSVLTRPNRALFFPNLYQHHVSPFELVDKTRPGHRKILALFLVDPQIPIISTAIVPPQQRDWWARQVELKDTQLSKLPQEVRDMVFSQDVMPVGLEEAKVIREELMDERTVLQEGVNGQLSYSSWNFCEH
ncbi:uncharacterized protein J7T54_002351 [Emericellopsis cladophorae]|uniref:Uncharacterized protein n=1 Tax=Emericellopsis cladophorae TaxID=2686198 RepID=A0A9P9Y379_9HYPO|nr:uncharacterized protein J7T54_002351 [Emericellopsis cladophorae]KAI6782114.1 hypothetical protein J7T54_002351 [Emericellopsis cladophorae]